MGSISYPKVVLTKDQKVYLDFKIDSKRVRVFNGSKFQIDLNPNSFPIESRIHQANILAAEVYSKLLQGYNPLNTSINKRIYMESDLKLIELALKNRLSQSVSKHYERQLKYSFNALRKKVVGQEISKNTVLNVLDHFDNNTSYNTMRRSLKVLFNLAHEMGWDKNPMEGIKPRKDKAKLHKPIDNIRELLNEIKVYNENLFLCCLLTYACLLRPHREIRELKWSDFDKDLSHIRLSGDRNKSGRNRVVPVPQYVQEFLKKNEDRINIFSGKETPYDKDYFKGLWSRFKKTSKLLIEDQTLYSFRHSGAIEIYKRTGSLEKLKTVMGHSDLSVSLTYLRGLDVTNLKEEDMPRL